MSDKPIRANDGRASAGVTIYPAPFAQLVAGRTKRKLGELFGLRNFGVNLTTLEPGAISALLHCHAVQDEFVFILEGRPTLKLGDAEHPMGPGDCIGFKAGTGVGHQLINRTDSMVAYLELGDRSPGEQVTYPNDDIAASVGPSGAWIVTHKDGTPY